MKLVVKCMGKGSEVSIPAGREVVVYYVDFVVKKEPNPHNQHFFGNMKIQSLDGPFDAYEEQKEYLVDFGINIMTADPNDLKRIKSQLGTPGNNN